jgi:hypothetical protein
MLQPEIFINEEKKKIRISSEKHIHQRFNYDELNGFLTNNLTNEIRIHSLCKDNFDGESIKLFLEYDKFNCTGWFNNYKKILEMHKNKEINDNDMNLTVFLNKTVHIVV